MAAIVIPLVIGVAGLMAMVAGLVFHDDRLAWEGVIATAFSIVALLMRFIRMRRVMHGYTLLTGALGDLSVGHLICDREGSAVFVNTSFRTLVDAASDESPLWALERQLGSAPDSLSAFTHMRERARAGMPAVAELTVPREGRSPEWRLVRAQPIVGFPGAMHWRIEDVTARRELEQVMLNEQGKLVDFIENAPIGFFSVDQYGTFLFVNATLARWLGCASHDLVERGRRVHEVLDSPPRDARPYDLFEHGDAEQSGDLTMRGLQGRRFQASVVQTVVTDDNGTVHTRSVVRDLTQEHEWQEALRLSQKRFQRFFEDAPIAIALVNREGKLDECNRAFLTLLASQGSQMIGQSFFEVIEPRERGGVAARFASVLDGHDPEAPLEVRMASGRDVVVQLYVRRLEMNGVGEGGLILHFIDLTERRNLEAQFTQSQKMQAVGQLAGGVAHDFNNLLTAMLGFCDLLLLRHKPGDQSFSDIMQIKQNANRAANLVRQLLAFSRQQTLQPRVLDVTDVLAELSNLLRRLIGENIELRMLHGRNLGLIKVDQNQLEQVIINLVVNARDAMPGGGRLTVVTSNYTVSTPERREQETILPGDYVSIDVIDTGAGIPRENLQRIFEPFFTTKEVGSGTGLGLSTVYGIVRQTGGFITVDSALGEGAKFSILLPCHHGETKHVDAEPRERRSSDLTGTGTILLVEDEDAVRVFSARALRNKGYQVLEAKNGEVAMQLLSAESAKIDLLITDVVMPQMDGPTLARNVRKIRPDMSVIFISGYAEDRFRDELDGGDSAAHFLPKPFSLKQLASKVKEVIKG